MDKIGLDGVKEDLISHGFEQSNVEKYLELFKGLEEHTPRFVVHTETLHTALSRKHRLGSLEYGMVGTLIHLCK